MQDGEENGRRKRLSTYESTHCIGWKKFSKKKDVPPSSGPFFTKNSASDGLTPPPDGLRSCGAARDQSSPIGPAATPPGAGRSCGRAMNSSVVPQAVRPERKAGRRETRAFPSPAVGRKEDLPTMALRSSVPSPRLPQDAPSPCGKLFNVMRRADVCRPEEKHPFC